MALLIRNAKERDMASILSLMDELKEIYPASEEEDIQDARRLFIHISNHTELYENFIAEAEGNVVGFLSLAFFKTFYHYGGTAAINELIVNKSARGRGIGKSLIKEAIDIARSKCMDEVEVSTGFDNTDAQNFYTEMGFHDRSLLLSMELNTR